MRKIVIFLIVSLVFSGVYGQEDGRLSKSELKQLQRDQKKAEGAALREQMAELTHLMITHQQFVLEAEYLSNRYGSRIHVQSMINFILVDSVQGTLQFGSAMAAGYNGVGGATLDGGINQYRYTVIGKRKDSYSIQINFMSAIGAYDISMIVNSDGYADATIRGNWSGSLSYHGRLVPLELSRIYKGTPSY